MSGSRQAVRGGQEVSGIALLEQAVLLLRAAPVSAWAVYLLGSIPFITGLFWFSVDSLRNIFAPKHLFVHSLAIAGLFLWKQVTESLFLSQLHHALNGTQGQPSARRMAGVLLRQAAVQPSGFLAVPFALISGLPAPFTLFFYAISLFLRSRILRPRCGGRGARHGCSRARRGFS